MIYTIAEYAATITECIIILVFLIFSLEYKPAPKQDKIHKTIAFSALIITNALLWDNVSVLFRHELLHICSYILLFYIAALSILNGKWWHKLVVIMIAILSVFLVNLLVTACSGMILKNHYAQILLMRNPTRIFLLFLTKLGLAAILFVTGNFIRNQKYTLHLTQCIVTVALLITSLITGVTVEKLLLDNIVSHKYASIIMICISVIVVLLFFIIIQFSIKNKADILRVSLQTRLHDDEIRINELIQMNHSVRTLKHDLNNHITVLKKLISEHDFQQAMNYIEKIYDNVSDIPATSNTNNSTLNAILDVKKLICKNENIDLKCYLRNDLPEFDSFSFSKVFGNLLDNAIEAEMKEEIREIKISVMSENNNIDIIVQNRISHNILINGKLPETTKKDNINHGLGMISITEAVNKSNGAIDIYEQDDWFVVHVIMPC